MTQREKTLAGGLAVALGLAVSAGLLYFFALEPLTEANDRVERAQTQLDQKEGELAQERLVIGGIQKIDPRLTLVDEISLPPRDPKLKRDEKMNDAQRKRHVETLQVDYERYLAEMMQKKGFRPESISVQMGQVEKQAVAKGKQPTYERIAFRVAGRGELGCVTGFMEEFHKAPLLHQIRNATVDLASARGSKTGEGELEMKATVEALLVTGARDRATLLPSKLTYPLKVMADPPRNYVLMTAKNMFTGIKPQVAKKQGKTQEELAAEKKAWEERGRKREEQKEVLRFVKLTTLYSDPERDRWWATVYDQAKGGPETKLNTGSFKELTVYDKYHEVTLDARVVYVDEKQLVFREEKGGKKSFYRLRIGDFVYPAILKPMRKDELKELGIEAD